MEIFEFHFNNKEIEDVVFDSLISTKKSKNGSLFCVGQISNAYPKSKELLIEINTLIKDNFYEQDNDSKQAFKTSLIKANSFLKQKVKKDETNWLGNLDFASLNVKKDLINFVKLGEIKILLLRGDEVFDISDNLEDQTLDSDPGSYFLNIAIGKLSNGDRMIITTPDLYNVLEDEDILSELIKEEWNQKDLAGIFKEYKDELRETKGMILMLAFNGAPEVKEKFSMPKINIPQLPEFNFSKKKILIALAVPLVIFAGYFTFTQLQKKEVKEIKTVPIVKEEPKEITEEISKPEPTIPALYSFAKDDFSPENLVVINNAIYLYNSSGKTFYKINLKDLKTIKTSTNYNFSNPVTGGGSIYFFVAPNTIVEHISTKDIIGSQDLTLDSHIRIDDLFYYNSKLYFLDTTEGSIYKKSKETIVIWGNDKRIKEAKSFAIDGNVWILREKNKIDRYFQGKHKETLEIQGVVNATKIWTQRGIDNIYMLDKGGNKIVIINSTGDIIKEYSDIGLTDIKDFYVLNGTIYIINNTEIYKLN